MLIAAFDTSTLEGVVGWILTTDASQRAPLTGFAEYRAPVRPGHAETLLPRLRTVLSDGGVGLGDVDLLVIGRGPGTFTGLRIGFSTAKGIALASGVPVKGISSLEALALSACSSGPVAAIIDARRGELFGACYEVRNPGIWPETEVRVEEHVGPAEQVIAAISNATKDGPVCWVGTGIGPYRREIEALLAEQAVFLPETYWSPSATWMARVGYERYCRSGPEDLDTFAPTYLREPDARLPKPGSNTVPRG